MTRYDASFRRKVGRRLRLLRLAQTPPTSQQAVAVAVDITQASLSNYETGKRDIPLITAAAIADYFGKSIIVIGGTGDLT